ncbi:hypothetical protein NSTCB13_04762 [Nostoc sp. DSM 114160]
MSGKGFRNLSQLRVNSLKVMPSNKLGILKIFFTNQLLMRWVAKKSSLARVPYQPAEVRGVYLHLMDYLIQCNYSDFESLPRILAFDLALTGASDGDFYKTCVSETGGIGTPGLSFEVIIFFEYKKIYAVRQGSNTILHNRFDLNFDLALERNPSPELQILLDNLKSQFPPSKNDSEAFKHWWKTDGQVWNEQLRTVMIEHCNIGHDWQINEAQKTLLQEYLYANKLLVECLNSECYVSWEVRQEIENTLLLPNKN